MDDNASWLAFKDQLQSHYEALESYHRELGGDYEDSSATLMDVLQAALQASLQATKLECDRVREDCESMLRDMSRMRLAMGDTLKLPEHGDPFTDYEPRARIKAPLLDSQKVLRIEHSATRKAFEDRAAKVTEMYHRIKDFSSIIPENCIGIEIPIIDEDHPPEDVSLLKLGQLDTIIAHCSQEVILRKRQVQVYGREIVQLWAELAIETYTIDSQHDRAILLDAQKQPEALGLMDEDIASLHDKREALIEEKLRRKQHIDLLKGSIQSLHRKLHLPEADLTAFSLRIRGFAKTVIKMCEEELARLVELKKDHIEDFVKDARLVLADLWEKLYYGEEDRSTFTPAFTSVYTDASLQAHENEITKLRAKTEELTPLLNLVAKHMALVQEREDLEVQVSDSSRFSKRGYNPMAESKLRARIENTMPKVEDALRESLSAYEQKHGVPFLIRGEVYLDTQVVTRKPISRPESGQSRSARSDSVSTNIGNTKKTRPRTPSTLARPMTGNRSINLPGRSISTPMQSHLSSERDSSQSPTKRAVSHHVASSIVRTNVLRERVDHNSTRLPTRPVSSRTQHKSVQSTPKTFVAEAFATRTHPPLNDEKPSRILPHESLRSVLSNGVGVSGSSTSSQVSTENWDAFHPSSDDDLESSDRGRERTATTYDLARPGELLDKHRFNPTSSITSKKGLPESSIEEVPEEASFIDEWGEEGF